MQQAIFGRTEENSPMIWLSLGLSLWSLWVSKTSRWF